MPIAEGPTTRGFDSYFGVDLPNYPPYCFIAKDRTVGIPSVPNRPEFNGCCGGRETKGRFGVCLHDTRCVRKVRIPVQFMEMGWWLLGGAGFIWLWPQLFAPGTYALGVLSWYGFGRFWLEPLREAPDLVGGRVRINQVVAGLLAFAAGCGLLIRAFAS